MYIFSYIYNVGWVSNFDITVILNWYPTWGWRSQFKKVTFQDIYKEETIYQDSHQEIKWPLKLLNKKLGQPLKVPKNDLPRRSPLKRIWTTLRHLRMAFHGVLYSKKIGWPKDAWRQHFKEFSIGEHSMHLKEIGRPLKTFKDNLPRNSSLATFQGTQEKYRRPFKMVDCG